MKALSDKVQGHLSIGIVTLGTLLCLVFPAADRVSAATFSTENGEVLIEAENYTRMAGTTGASWSKTTTIGGYKGSGYMQASYADPKTLQYSSSISRLEYEINFKETGTYYLHLRTWAKEHTENGFFATIDGRQFDYGCPHAYFVYVHKPGAWQWYTDGGGAERRNCIVSINITKTGVQTLGILRRDKGSKLDRIWLTKHQSVPLTVSELDPSDPAQFTVNATFIGLGAGSLSDEFSEIVCSGSNGDLCSESYGADSDVTLTASAETGSIFWNWGGDCAGSDGNTCTLSLDEDKVVEAVFLLSGHANPIDAARLETLTADERDLVLNLTDGTTQFSADASISELSIEDNTATIVYGDEKSLRVTIKDGGRYTDDFITLALLRRDYFSDSVFAAAFDLSSFSAEVNSAQDLVRFCYPAMIHSGGEGIAIGDLELFKLKSVSQASIPFTYREDAEEAISEGDFWITEHRTDTILPVNETIEPGQKVDIYLAIADNGSYDLDGTAEVIVSPLTLGRTVQGTAPSYDTLPADSGGGGGGCFIGALADFQ